MTFGDITRSILIGVLIGLTLIAGVLTVITYKVYDKADCAQTAQATGVGYRWSIRHGCEFQNPWTGILEKRE